MSSLTWKRQDLVIDATTSSVINSTSKYSGTDYICSTTCSTDFVTIFKCIAQCPNGQVFQPINSEKSCVTTCSGGLWVSTKRCLQNRLSDHVQQSYDNHRREQQSVFHRVSFLTVFHEHHRSHLQNPVRFEDYLLRICPFNIQCGGAGSCKQLLHLFFIFHHSLLNSTSIDGMTHFIQS
ncbi:Hypothetical_protein [Hexamita inflata]|uniref:Hypothetical_protein n=1 Tax=Hexamita inflata TaxID=28002 RepID=A0ABP1HG66_9EUKA